jgi:hypothetical protein
MNTMLVVCVAGTMLVLGERARGSGTMPDDPMLRTCCPVVLYRAMDAKRYEPACVISLRHPIEGVVECALRDAMLLKIAQPEVDVPDIKDEIDRLTTEGSTPVIRYKALLAKQVYENPALFASLVHADFFTAEAAFTAVADQLELALLAARQ